MERALGLGLWLVLDIRWGQRQIPPRKVHLAINKEALEVCMVEGCPAGFVG